jgi:hypothetical protein
MSTLIIPRHLANERTIPEWFTNGLKDIDPSLIVYWNHLRGRWTIDRCTVAGEKHTSNHTHDASCTTTNVKVVQDESGEYMPLCQDVLDWLRAHDTWTQTKTLDQCLLEMSNRFEAYQNKLKRERRDNTRRVTLEHKPQLLKMKHLIDQHDLKVNQ